jgi:uncharacterized membrane protein YphA (DoxX/SURF4 family)
MVFGMNFDWSNVSWENGSTKHTNANVVSALEFINLEYSKMKRDQMKVGVWLYGSATVATGILDVVWREFEASHQPIKSFGQHIPGEQVLAIVAGIWLLAAGIAILWRPTMRIGAAGLAAIYFIFALFWVPRLFSMTHTLGFKIGVIVFVLGGIAAQLLLASPALIVYALIATPDSARRDRAVIAARWLLGLPPIAFGLGHLINLHAYSRFVPHWVPFGLFWVVLTGIAFLLAGSAIISGIKDVLAARLLALMLLLFEFMVEIPPVFAHPRSQGAWGGAVYNLTAIGACWIFAEFIGGRLVKRRELDPVEHFAAAD